MKYINNEDLSFLQEAKNWRDDSLEKGKNPQTYIDANKDYIALFHDESIEVYQLGNEVAFFINIK